MHPTINRLGLKLAVGQRRHQPPAPDATDLGYLVSRETGRGRPARTVLGDPTPEMLELLPEPGELAVAD
jgi:hypothetical protein